MCIRDRSAIELLNDISERETGFSILRENSSSLATAIGLQVSSEQQVKICHGVIARNILATCPVVQNMRFERCFIMPQVLTGTRVIGCVFDQCEIEELEIHNITVQETRLEGNTTCAAVTIGEDGNTVFDPTQIEALLRAHGFEFHREEGEQPTEVELQIDPELEQAIRFFRIFGRATGVNESVLKMRLGSASSDFMDNVLPRLMDAGIVELVEYRGSGTQSRYSLGEPLRQVQGAIERCNGSFDRFVQLAGE